MEKVHLKIGRLRHLFRSISFFSNSFCGVEIVDYQGIRTLIVGVDHYQDRLGRAGSKLSFLSSLNLKNNLTIFENMENKVKEARVSPLKTLHR